MIDRAELHRRLDALVDEIEARDARNDDVGRLAWVNSVVPRIGDFLVEAGFDRPAKHLFAAEAAEALGAQVDDLDARSLSGETVRLPDEDARLAHQVALARLVLLLLGRLIPTGYAMALAQSLHAASVGDDPGVLLGKSKPANRESKASGLEAMLLRRMVLRAAYESKLYRRKFDDVLADEFRISLATVKHPKKAASREDREAAFALGYAHRDGKPPSADAERIWEHIRDWDWPAVRARREEFRKGNLWPEGRG